MLIRGFVTYIRKRQTEYPKVKVTGTILAKFVYNYVLFSLLKYKTL